MEQKSIWDECTNVYSLQKTLRFELRPQGKTKEYIEKNGLLQQDEKRAENYKKVKKIIDEYHKKFIEESLSSGLLDKDTLQEFSDLYSKLKKEKKKNKEDEESIEEMQKELRKQIRNLFENNEKWKSLFSKELIKKELMSFTGDENKRIIREFNKFTTYFTGFHENRKNMYSDEDKSTAISHRIIHDNLPKFLDNISIYNRIKESGIDLATIEMELEPVFQGHKLNDIFSISYFNKILTQKGIDFYNAILGGIAEKSRNKIRGINEYVNTEYNQKQQDKKNRIPKLSPLYKQILSDRETASFIITSFEGENELLEALENFYTNELINCKIDGKTQNIFTQFKQLFQNLPSFDRSKIYLRNDSLSSISTRLFGEWAIISNALSEWYDRHELGGKKKITKKDNKKKEDWLKQDYMSILIIETALSEYEHDAVKKDECNGLLLNYLASFKKKKDYEKNIIQQIEAEYSHVRPLLNTSYPKGKKLTSEEVDVSKIKAFLDALLDFFHFVKPLSLKNPKKNIILEKDEGFYGSFAPLFEQVDNTPQLYNKVRNYLTKKPYITEKIKLNFENSTLLKGWDLNKEADNTSVLFRKNGLYYLGIMDATHRKIFKEIPRAKDGEIVFEKMLYKLLPGANKMLPKVFIHSPKGKAKFKPSEDLLTKYKDGTHKKGDNFSLNDCHKLIDFFKASIAMHEDWKHFNHQFSDTLSYTDLSGFYREVEKEGYKVTFQDIPESYINKLVNEGKLYLFQIYNKDFSQYSKGKPNMHTLYWKMLFDQENLKNVVYKLNGEAEVFFRKASLRLENTPAHKANEVINNKNPDNEKKQSTFKYDIIKDRRYTVDKFQFHVPITLNFKAEGRENQNIKALELLKNNKNVKIIGIDRGERHLLYLTLINQKGKILLQESLNEIVNNYRGKSGKIQEKRTDYRSLLDRREIKRDEARRNWGLIENIKELKEGYVSQVVHYIAKLMIEYNAIVVMEDLNFGFKRGREKVEKQVYQKFEKMLIEKLNYLVFKDKKADETGGTLKALQLTNKFTSFQALGKQSGFIFYVPSALTSKIDPITGFADFLKPQYESVKKAKLFFGRFEKIKFNTKQEWFELSFNYKDFTDKAEGSKNDWVLCTTKYERFIWDRTMNNGKGAQKSVNVNNELKDLFDKENITYIDGKDIKEQILAKQSVDFFKKLMKLLCVLVSLRHNNGLKGKEEKDYILSPVEPFFNSLEAKAGEPKDADANGSYHIALKGLWVLQQVAKAEDLRRVKLAMSNKEWLKFAQTQTL